MRRPQRQILPCGCQLDLAGRIEGPCDQIVRIYEELRELVSTGPMVRDPDSRLEVAKREEVLRKHVRAGKAEARKAAK